MDGITKQLAQVHRRLEKYLDRFKSALDDASKAIIADAIADADKLIVRAVELGRAGESRMLVDTGAWYNTYIAASDRFATANGICGDMRIVRRASIGLTTADEIVLQGIATAAVDALVGIAAIDTRGAIIADSAAFDSGDVLGYVANAGVADLFSATLIADRGLGANISAGTFDAARDAALGIDRGTAAVYMAESIMAVPPLSARADISTVVAGLIDTAPIVVLHRRSGSTLWSNYAALLTPGKFSEHGGLTRAVIERFTTIVPGSTRNADLPVVGVLTTPAPITVDTDLSTITSAQVHVIETNDGVTFAAWSAGRALPVNHPQVARLLGRAPTARFVAYHSMMEPLIISRAIDPSIAGISRQYATDKLEYSGTTTLEAARKAIADRIATADIRSRADFMKVALDRDANVEAVLSTSATGSAGPSVRAAIAREEAVRNFVVIFEKKVHANAPGVDEFAKYDDPRRLVNIVLSTTIDATITDAKRKKIFVSADRSLADYIRAAARR